MAPAESCSVTVSADFETVTPAVLSSLIVTVTVHTDPQELPDASTTEMLAELCPRSNKMSKVSSSSSSASSLIVMLNVSSACQTPPFAEKSPTGKLRDAPN